ncbi:MAG: multicopper oxidase domain-containing protein [Nitrospirota bacterium]
MKRRYNSMRFILLFLMLFGAVPAGADILVQCPGDTNGDAVWTPPEVQPVNTVCIHLTSGDGFIKMGDGYDQYMFGFKDVTGVPRNEVMNVGMLAAEFAAPTIKVKEGQNVYLTLSNVGMVMRPDLFDAHTVHWHGFPFTAPVFDGEPMASIAINMGSSLTYYYVAPDPGTYMYHCHFEATEHMQMGMLGNLYVTPLQDGTMVGGCTSMKYVFNDGDGSTCYDVDYPIQLLSFDPRFHDNHINVQPLPFANMKDTYPMINGRGYPETVNTAGDTDGDGVIDDLNAPGVVTNVNGLVSQKIHAKVVATQGQRVLLRISSLSTVEYYTVRTLGIPMLVVGKDAKQLKGPSGNFYYTTDSLTLGGGESFDVILNTTNIAPGTYFLYTTNLNHLSNDNEDYGGMMTEIVINPI